MLVASIFFFSHIVFKRLISQGCLNLRLCGRVNPFLHRHSFQCIKNRHLLKTLWENKELLVTSNFFFSYNFFYSIRKLYPHLSIFSTSFLAHLNTTCSRGDLRVVMCLSSTISISIFSSQTAGPIWTKLGRDVPWQVLFENSSHNFIPSKTLVAMATEWNFLSNSLKIFSSGTAGPILK